MEFKPYWQALRPDERETFAKNVGTSVGYCHQIAYGDKRVELGLADAMVTHSSGNLTLESLPLTERAVFQHAARSGAKVVDESAQDSPTKA